MTCWTWNLLVGILYVVGALFVVILIAACITVSRMAWDFGRWLSKRLQLWLELRLMSSRSRSR